MDTPLPGTPLEELGGPRSPRLNSRFLSICCGVLLGAQIGLTTLAASHGHFLIRDGGELGYDFSCFWGAGRLALRGDAIAAYDWSRLKEVLDLGVSFSADPHRRPLPFFYPPIFLLALAPFALLPFGASMAAWLAATLAAYVASLRAILPGATATITALGAPFVLFNIWTGQNGFLTAALLGGALVLLDRRPIASGVLIGLLIYKPHFGLLFPVVLAATGRWRTFASAAATIAAGAVVTGLVFGWRIFGVAAAALWSAGQFNLAIEPIHLFRLQSIYGMLRNAGLGSGMAWSVHLAVAGAATAATVWIWRGRSALAVKAAAFSTAALIVTPYTMMYDMPLLAVPFAFLVRDGLENGFQPWQARALGALLAVTLVLGYAFPILHEPVTPVIYAGLAAIIARRVLPAGEALIGSRLAES